MKNNWKIFCGIVALTSMLVSTGCGLNPNNILNSSNSNPDSNVADSGDGDDIQILNGGESLNDVPGFGSDKTGEVAEADLAILDELPDILRNSDLPKMNHYSDDTDVSVLYYDTRISGYLGLVCYKDGSVEIYYNCDNDGMRLEFKRPNGTYLSYTVRGITKDNVNAPVFGAYEMPISGSEFAEISKDFYKNCGGYVTYYSEYDFTEDKNVYLENLNTIFARFGVLSNEAFDELGLSWEDFGINFGDEYKKYDECKALGGSDDKTPMILEKQTFTDGKSDTTGKTWIQTVHDGIITEDMYYSEKDESESWFAVTENNSNFKVNGSDYIQLETYKDEDGFDAFYHSSYYETEDRFASKSLYLSFYENEDNEIAISYNYETDFHATSTPGVIDGGTNMGFSVYCKASEVKDIFASKESLKAALEEFPNSLYQESEYMTNDEMLEEFLSKFHKYMASIDDSIKTTGASMSDYGIEY